MTAVASVPGLIGYPQISNITPGFDQEAKVTLGTIISGNDPYWGGGEYIYLKMPITTTTPAGSLLAYDVATAFTATLLANADGTAKSFAVLVNALAPVAVTDAPQYGWAKIAGYAPVWSDASIAADTTASVVAAGQAGAAATGQQLQGFRVTKPATGSDVVKAAGTVNRTIGNATLATYDTSGLIVGMLCSGTGIPATTYITAIDMFSITISNVPTTTGNSAFTASYAATPNFWNLCTFDRPHTQGALT